ncbi:hypothetical protein [Pleurocapsa sp. PCC 7319]|uniref:hypothetical protein n=1 Tax=Pleurocapsa sp. PCC 7319 TaxID=118161 RepID=UPI00034DD848|nr:hypothetical protein [Pleurocapsa sp. PCC 7319]
MNQIISQQKTIQLSAIAKESSIAPIASVQAIGDLRAIAHNNLNHLIKMIESR